MPCYERRRISLDLPKALPGLVEAALKAMLYKHVVVTAQGVVTARRDLYSSPAVTFTPGKGIVASETFNTIEFKQQYGRAAVRQAAAKLGWAAKPQGQGYRLERRTF
jgi:hypothetical protein